MLFAVVRGGSPRFQPGAKETRLDREKISAADFSRLLFFYGVFELPKWDVDPYDELVLKAADQLRPSQDVALHRALKIAF